MTDDGHRLGDDASVKASAAGALDRDDLLVLHGIAAVYDAVDPPPEDLVERVRFALALGEVFDEVAQITRLPLDAMAVRGEQSAVTRTETLTFSADRLTAMVTTTHPARDQVRIDGWLAPPERMRVRLRMEAGQREVTSDEAGRFSFEGLRDGFAQLTFHPLVGAVEGHTVVTPLFQL